MKISGLFSDGMILQRGKRNLFYGYATPGALLSFILHKEGHCCYKEEFGPEFPADDLLGLSFRVGEDGYFEIVIPPRDDEDPLEIILTDVTDTADRKETIYIKNILMGDVYLLGGQSNMELTVGMIPDANEETLRTANNDKIRMFNVPHEYDFTGKPRVLDSVPWKSVNKDTIAEFSAIGYYFAKEKYKNDRVPVGLIQTAVGGAPIEALMSEENILKQAALIRQKLDVNGDCNHGNMNGSTPVMNGSTPVVESGLHLGACPQNVNQIYNLEHDKHRGCIYCYEELLERDKQPGYPESISRADLERVAKWHADLDEADRGLKEEWYRTNFTDDECEKYSAPSMFKGTKYEGYFGTLWLQKEFYVSELHAGKEAKLYLGTLVDFDTAYVNGVSVGQTDYRYPQRRYVIPEGVIKPGKNTVTVRLGMDGSTGGFLMDMPYKVSIKVDIPGGGCTSNCSSCGGDCNNNRGCKNKKTEIINISLEGDWLIKEGARAEKLDGETFFIWHPSALFNSMIAPLKGLAVDAILFYQGESNGYAPEYYDVLFKAMVDEWRTLVGEVPIYYAELAEYLGDDSSNSDEFLPLREVQQMVERNHLIEDSYLIETTKLSAPYNELHPQNKAELAHMFYERFC